MEGRGAKGAVSLNGVVEDQTVRGSVQVASNDVRGGGLDQLVVHGLDRGHAGVRAQQQGGDANDVRGGHGGSRDGVGGGGRALPSRDNVHTGSESIDTPTPGREGGDRIVDV